MSLYVSIIRTYFNRLTVHFFCKGEKKDRKIFTESCVELVEAEMAIVVVVVIA